MSRNQELKSNAHCVFRIYYHIVFVTKYRKNVLTEIMLKRAEEHFERIIKRAHCELTECNGEPNHIHLIVDANPNITPSKLVNTLKTISSREIWREFEPELKKTYYRNRVLWHRAYCIVSAGGAPLEILKQYVQNQGQDSDG